MPFPSGTYILQVTDPNVRAELEQFYSLLQGYLSAEHTEAGAHAAVTAQSVTVSGNVTVSGDTSVDDLAVAGLIRSLGMRSASGTASVIPVGGTFARTPVIRITSAPSLLPNMAGMSADPVSDTNVGVLYLVLNASGSAWTLTHEDTVNVPVPGCRFALPGGVNATVPDKAAFWVYYDATTVRWRTVGLTSAWNAWTPSWTNLTVGNGTVTARYTRANGTTFFRIYVTFGSTTTVGGSVSFDVPTPTTAVIASAGSYGAAADYRDSSVPSIYRGEARVASTTATATTMTLFDNANPTAALGAAAPFAWATGDSISIVGSYEEA